MNGVRFEATRAAIERARLALSTGPIDPVARSAQDRILDEVLSAVSFDEDCVSQKFAELTKTTTPDHIDTPLDGGGRDE